MYWIRHGQLNLSQPSQLSSVSGTKRHSFATANSKYLKRMLRHGKGITCSSSKSSLKIPFFARSEKIGMHTHPVHYITKHYLNVNINTKINVISTLTSTSNMCITLHYITLHHRTLHHITLHYRLLHRIAVCCCLSY